jgi:hypothetical protein
MPVYYLRKGILQTSKINPLFVKKVNAFNLKLESRMKKISLVVLFFMAACQNSSNQNEMPEPSDIPMVGADKDAHGCIGSAGYTWSVVKDSCIRVFESGTRFISYDQVTGAEDSTKTAFVVLSNDQLKAEAFFDATNKPVVMDAVTVMEGETMPVLFENKTELVKLRYYRDSYQLLYKDTIRYMQLYAADKGLKTLLQKK